MAKQAWIRWYPSDWLSSKKRAMMSYAERGMYIDLLNYSHNGGLPDDDEQLRRLLGVDEATFKGASTTLRACFINHDGRLYNERWLEEEKNYREFMEKSKKGGEISAEQRKAKKEAETKDNLENDGLKGGSRVVEPTSDKSAFSIQHSAVSITKDSKSLYTRAFETWNENAPPLTKHMKLAGSFKTNVERAINGKLEEGFTEDDILKAIQNYADVISDQTKYYFSHKWPLDAFLRQRNALPNFVDAATPLTNYLRDKTSPAASPSSPPKYIPETDVPQWVIDQYGESDPCKLYYIRETWEFMDRRWDDIHTKTYVTEEMREWWRKSKHNPENQGISE